MGDSLKTYNVSVIIIGKNVSKTLFDCISSVKNAINFDPNINLSEIIYVDSNSSDNSIQIAQVNNVKIINIISTFTTASLGRFLGIRHAKYNKLLFIDGDMVLEKDWFSKTNAIIDTHLGVVGDRYEVLIKNDTIIKEIPHFYNYKNFQKASKIGGFIYFNNSQTPSANFSPFLREEEECDFYAKIRSTVSFYEVPYHGFQHLNRNLSGQRLLSYLQPYVKMGYLLSLFKSIKDGYFLNYSVIQKKYIKSILISLLAYALPIYLNFYSLILILLLLFSNNKSDIRGVIITAIAFPYKLITSIYFLIKYRNGIDLEYSFDSLQFKEKIML
ncbi:MAG: glycosyltransferase family 2 protein [Bacteroidetes bacterium]|nr:glycosyltransferase family 2 protein [Bacteroidota bacterium]